jgi:hypothetical protein
MTPKKEDIAKEDYSPQALQAESRLVSLGQRMRLLSLPSNDPV